jgi:hypothetical protein
VHPSAEISVVLADGFGHMRASLTGDQSAAQARVDELFERHLKGAGGSPTLPAVETYTQACTGSTETGPFTGNTWDDVHPAEIVFSDAAVRIFTEAAGSALTALVTGPVAGGLTSCRTTSDADDAAASTYRLPAATGAGYTLMGSPRVSAVFDITGADPDFAQVVARLWDVGTNGQQALVTQALYRPEVGSSAPQTFILHPNGWHFVDGHVAKLELLGQSVPYGRASNGGWTVAVSDLQLVLPVAEISSGGGPLACAPAPVAGCKGMTVSGGASLAMKDRPGGGDRLVWKMRKVDATTPADLGDPLSDTGYTLCSYDATGEIITAHLVPSAGTCGNGKPCWKTFSRGYKYRDRESTPDGIFAAKLQSGEAGKAKLQVKGKGVLLGVPALPVGPLPITVQLIADSGACWEALYSAAAKNDAGGFKARSD